MFEYKITLNDNDYIQYNKYHLLNSPSGKKSIWIYRLFIPVICFMVVIIFAVTGSDSLFVWSEAAAMLIISVLWITFSKQILIKSLEKNLKKLKKEGKLPYIKESVVKLDDEGIHIISSDTESKIKYSTIEKITESEKAIYIYIASIQAIIIPVTVFSDDMEKAKFLKFVHSKSNMQ